MESNHCIPQPAPELAGVSEDPQSVHPPVNQPSFTDNEDGLIVLVDPSLCAAEEY